MDAYSKERVVVIRHLSKHEATVVELIVDKLFEYAVVQTLNNTNACLENATGHIILEL